MGGAQANPPNWEAVPQDDLLGVTVVLLTCSYNGQEFIRVGYYVNNEYGDEALRENPPPFVAIERVCRSILSEQPRVTRFPIDFDGAAMGDEDGGAMDEEAGDACARFGGAAGEQENAVPITPAEAAGSYWLYHQGMASEQSPSGIMA